MMMMTMTKMMLLTLPRGALAARQDAIRLLGVAALALADHLAVVLFLLDALALLKLAAGHADVLGAARRVELRAAAQARERARQPVERRAERRHLRGLWLLLLVGK